MKPISLSVCLCLCLVTGCSLGKKPTAQQPATQATPAGDKSLESTSPQPATDQPNSVGADTEIKDDLHTPAKGTPEREGIMDVLRAEVKKETGEEVVFVVNLLKVHNGWAWVDVTPNRKDGTALYEGKEALMHQERGAWKDMALPPQDSDDDQRMFGDLSRKYIKKIQKQYPSCPADIFPKPSD